MLPASTEHQRSRERPGIPGSGKSDLSFLGLIWFDLGARASCSLIWASCLKSSERLGRMPRRTGRMPALPILTPSASTRPHARKWRDWFDLIGFTRMDSVRSAARLSNEDVRRVRRPRRTASPAGGTPHVPATSRLGCRVHTSRQGCLCHFSLPSIWFVLVCFGLFWLVFA